MRVAIYERDHVSHAWHFMRVAEQENAELARDVNTGFGVQTLLVPVLDTLRLPKLLDSHQKQEDFDRIIPPPH